MLLALHGLPGPAQQGGEAQAAACGVEPGAPGTAAVAWISQQEARALVAADGVAFVDCRPREDFEAGHVSGSVHLPEHADHPLEALLQRLGAVSTVITYCNDACEHSSEIAARLLAAGLPDVRVLEGGMPAWLDNGFPAQSGACIDCGRHN